MSENVDDNDPTVILLERIAITTERIAFWVTLWGVLSVVGVILTLLAVISNRSS